MSLIYQSHYPYFNLFYLLTANKNADDDDNDNSDNIKNENDEIFFHNFSSISKEKMENFLIKFSSNSFLFTFFSP